MTRAEFNFGGVNSYEFRSSELVKVDEDLKIDQHQLISRSSICRNVDKSTPILWEKEKFTTLFYSNIHNFRNRRLIAGYSEDIVIHVNCFLEKVYRWYEKTRKDYLEVIQRCLCEGPSYSDWLGDLLTSRFVDDHIYEPEAKRKSASTRKRFDDIFHYSHLIFWYEEEPDDFKYSYEECKDIPQEVKEFIKNELKIICNELIIEKIDEDRLSYNFSNSTCHEKEKYVSYARLNRKTVDYSHNLEGERLIVRVGPANTRDTVKLRLNSLNSVQKLSLLVRQIIKTLPESAMGLDETEFRRRYNYVTKRKESFSYIRDIKKCGFTYNSKLLYYISKELDALYPDYGFDLGIMFLNKIITSGDGSRFFSKGQQIPMKRGYCLGMASELVTLSQILLYRMITKDNLCFSSLRALFYHDDVVITGDCIEVDAYKNTDLFYLTELGIPYKERSTFTLKGGGVFLEEYYSDYWNTDKSIMDEMSILDKKYCINIVHAKFSMRSLFGLCKLNIELKKPLQEVISYWGFEFSPDEVIQTEKFGGWIELKTGSLDYSLHSPRTKGSDISFLKRAFDAETSKWRPINLKQKYKPPVEYVNKERVPRKPINVSLYNILSENYKDLSINVQKDLSRKGDKVTYWKALAKHRIEIFNKSIVDIKINYESLCHYVIHNDLGTFYMLPEELIPREGKSRSGVVLNINSYGDFKIDSNNSDISKRYDLEAAYLTNQMPNKGKKEKTLFLRAEGYPLGIILKKSRDFKNGILFSEKLDSNIRNYYLNIGLINFISSSLFNWIPTSCTIELPDRLKLLKSEFVDPGIEEFDDIFFSIIKQNNGVELLEMFMSFEEPIDYSLDLYHWLEANFKGQYKIDKTRSRFFTNCIVYVEPEVNTELLEIERMFKDFDFSAKLPEKVSLNTVPIINMEDIFREYEELEKRIQVIEPDAHISESYHVESIYVDDIDFSFNSEDEKLLESEQQHNFLRRCESQNKLFRVEEETGDNTADSASIKSCQSELIGNSVITEAADYESTENG